MKRLAVTSTSRIDLPLVRIVPHRRCYRKGSIRKVLCATCENRRALFEHAWPSLLSPLINSWVFAVDTRHFMNERVSESTNINYICAFNVSFIYLNLTTYLGNLCICIYLKRAPRQREYLQIIMRSDSASHNPSLSISLKYRRARRYYSHSQQVRLLAPFCMRHISGNRKRASKRRTESFELSNFTMRKNVEFKIILEIFMSRY